MTRRQLLLVAVPVVVTLLVGVVAWGAITTGGQQPAAAVVEAPPRGTGITSPPPSSGARSENGARDAALSYATASQEWLYLDDEQLDAAVRAVAAPEAADRLADQVVGEVGVAREALAVSPGRVWWLVRPLAWRVVSYAPDSARVAVWTVSVLSAADVAVPQANWLTVTVDLVWSDGGWLVERVADVAGPTPVLGTKDEPWQPEPFDEALDGFTRLDGEELAEVTS